jgi:hypothetical protein
MALWQRLFSQDYFSPLKDAQNHRLSAVLIQFARNCPTAGYPLVGGTRQRHFDGTSFEPRKLPENAATPTSRVHAVLGGFVFSKLIVGKPDRFSLLYHHLCT